MPPRAKHHRYSFPDNGSLTPESGFRITLKQGLAIIAVSLVAGSGYGGLLWNQLVQGASIESINKKLEIGTKLTADRVQEDSAARIKIREDFMTNQQKMTEVLGKLDTRLAVAETNQKATNDQLGKIVDLLQRGGSK